MRVIFALLLLFTLPNLALAAGDEFGARFGNAAPLALEESAEGLQNIEPAAGEEDDEETLWKLFLYGAEGGNGLETTGDRTPQSLKPPAL